MKLGTLFQWFKNFPNLFSKGFKPISLYMTKIPWSSCLVVVFILITWTPTVWAQYLLPKVKAPVAYGVLLKIESKSTLTSPELQHLIKHSGLIQAKYYQPLQFQVLKLESAATKNSELKALEAFCEQAKSIKGINHCELDLKLRVHFSADKTSCTPEAHYGNDSLVSLTKMAQKLSSAVNRCEIFPGPKLEGHLSGLSPFWAQEYTGSDLLRERIEADKTLEVKKINIGIWDASIDDHGYMVSNLIQGPSPVSTIPSTKNLPFHDLEEGGARFANELYEQNYEKCRASCSDYVNNSMYWENTKLVLSVVEKFVDEKMVVFVTSSGNRQSLMENDKRILAIQNKIIAVSSFAPNGVAATSSNYGQVTIGAPADEYIISRNSEGEFQHFGGTSAATPQVTAALAAFQIISGYKLNTSEAKQLLEQTAIKPPDLPAPNSYGAGILNAYAIGDVAFRLKKECEGEDSDCIKNGMGRAIRASTSMNDNTLNALSEYFPKCVNSNEINKSTNLVDCEAKKYYWKKIRAEALLNPSNVKLWSALGCIAKTEGMDINSEFYYSLANRYKKTDLEMLENATSDKDIKKVAKYVLGHKSWNDVDILNKIIDKNVANKEIAKNVLSEPHLKNNPELISRLLEKGNADSEIALFVLSQPHWKEHPEFVEVLLQKGTVDRQIAFMLSNPHWKDHPEWIEKLIEKGNGDSIKKVANTLDYSYLENYPELIIKLIENNKLNVDELIPMILAEPHWQENPKWVSWIEQLISRGKVDREIIKYIFSKPHPKLEVKWLEQIIEKRTTDKEVANTLTFSHWKNYPELVIKLIENNKLDDQEIKVLLSSPQWKDNPKLEPLRLKYKVK